MVKQKTQTEKGQASPGKLYQAINVERPEFGTDEKLVKKKVQPYVAFCKKIYTKFPGLGANAKFTQKYESAINFLGWDLKPEEYNAATKFVLFLGIFIVIVLCTVLALTGASAGLGNMFDSIMIGYLISFGIPLILLIYFYSVFQQYPLNQVKYETIKALTFVPEIIGYLIMSMKLVPNLEKAVEFAATHGHGKIADDLKTLLWEVKVGIKNSVGEGLDELAYKWGEVSIELKKALMKIRASVIETSEAKRYAILDATMDDTLASIRNKLEDYARNLSQPSMTMFYLGVLLPLLLIIILPVGSAFSGKAFAKPIYLVLIYDIIIPIACFFFAKKIVHNRPATYVPPVIPDTHPELPPKHTIVIGKKPVSVFLLIFLVLGIGIFSSIFLQNTFGNTKAKVLEEGFGDSEYDLCGGMTPEMLPPSEKSIIKGTKYNCVEEMEFWESPENDITPYFLIYGVILTIAFVISLWFYSESAYKRKLQIKYSKMEDEFKDALYVVASRLGENKPIEIAMANTQEFLPKSIVAKDLFGKVIDNIKVLGLNLESAVFDKTYGALKNNPSEIINSAMRLMVDSVQLGVSVASKTLMSFSMQLRNSDEVSKLLTTLITNVTSTLTTMAKFIAPIILGITTALQKIVINTLRSLSSSGAMEQMGNVIEGIESGVSSIGGSSISTGATSNIAGGLDMVTVNTLATSTQFLIIVGIYVILVVMIITWFTTMIEQDNLTLAKLRISQTLPIATILFVITCIVVNMVF